MLPDLLTRRDWYERLAERAAQPPRWLGPYERDVLMEAAAHAAITDGATPPFHLRSALIGEVVDLYDAVRRQRQDVASFERLVLEPLAEEAESDGDAGAERMLRQTRFLAATFRGYEARRDALDAHDEHTLREWLMTTRLARPYRRVVVAVADQTRDDNGLWSADFDLLDAPARRRSRRGGRHRGHARHRLVRAPPRSAPWPGLGVGSPDETPEADANRELLEVLTPRAC